MSTEPSLGAAEAQRLLDAASSGKHHGDEIVRRSVLPGVISIVLGVLIGAFLLLAVYVGPSAGPAFWVASSVAFGAMISVAMIIFAVHKTALPAGWMKRYLIGLALTMVLYLGAVVLMLQSITDSPMLWIPIALAVAAPIAIAGNLRSAR